MERTPGIGVTLHGNRFVSIVVAGVLLVTLPGCSRDDTRADLKALEDRVTALNQEITSLTHELASTNDALEAASNTAAAFEASHYALQDEVEGLKREADAAAARTSAAIQDLVAGVDLACSSTESELPATVLASFKKWLLSSGDDLPDDVAVTVVDTAGRNDQWTFHATFDTYFEQGVFLARPDDSFEVLLSGVWPSVAEVWTVMAQQFPEDDLSIAACIDVTPFVEPGA